VDLNIYLGKCATKFRSMNLQAFYICLILKIGCGCEILTMIHHIVSLAITSMDKSWMHKSRLSKDYELGVENFIKFGFLMQTMASFVVLV
jgi:hypothetical protein